MIDGGQLTITVEAVEPAALAGTTRCLFSADSIDGPIFSNLEIQIQRPFAVTDSFPRRILVC